MDENGYSQAETMLIKEIFEEHGKYLRNELRKKISKLRLNRSNNLSFSVDYNIVAENSFPKLEMEFTNYGRFIEIRWHNITRNRKALFPQKTETAAEPRNVCSPLHQAGLKGAAHRNKPDKHLVTVRCTLPFGFLLLFLQTLPVRCTCPTKGVFKNSVLSKKKTNSFYGVLINSKIVTFEPKVILL